MNIVLGFGSTEEMVRKKIIEELSNSENSQEVVERYGRDAKRFDKMSREEAPERYTYFYLRPDKIVFMHINRQHPFSPDGWALWKVEEDFVR